MRPFCCFKKIAKPQHKNHANLVGATTSEDEEDDNSIPTHALTTDIKDLSLHAEVYVLDYRGYFF